MFKGVVRTGIIWDIGFVNLGLGYKGTLWFPVLSQTSNQLYNFDNGLYLQVGIK